MTNLNANEVIIWPRDHSGTYGVPTGFTRETTMDALYGLGSAAGIDPSGTPAGNATHSHTATDHTHTQNSHAHNVTSGGPSATTSNREGGTGFASTSTHTHSSTVSGTATNQNATVTVNTASNDPPYIEVIFIKSDGSTSCPNGSVVLINDTTAPANWAFCDGTASTTLDMRNRFLKGAPTYSVGPPVVGNSGATGGSSNAHTHTTVAHTHTQNAHNHGTFNSGSARTPVIFSGSALAVASGHTHSIVSASTAATNQNATATMQNADGQPPFYVIPAIQNTSGVAQDLPNKAVTLWMGSLGSIPASRVLCDGNNSTPDLRGKFVKISSTIGGGGGTGGADQHSHTSNAHTHTQDTHAHSNTSGNNSASILSDPWSIPSTPNVTVGAHTHQHTFTIATVVATNQNATITIQNNTSQSNYPPYRTVAYLMRPVTAVSARLRTLMGVGS